jgi:hypothetical protein
MDIFWMHAFFIHCCSGMVLNGFATRGNHRLNRGKDWLAQRESIRWYGKKNEFAEISRYAAGIV